MKKKYTCAAMAIAVAVGLMGGTAQGAMPVPIVNAGFEDPALGDGGYTTGGINGWTQIAGGDIGVWNLQTSDFLTEAPEGFNAAYLYNVSTDGMGLGQVLSNNFQSANYTLTVKVGLTLYDTDPGYQVQLLAGGTVIAEDSNTLTLAQGEWKTATVTYTYNPAHSALLGQPLEIRLLGKSPATQMVFDDIQMNQRRRAYA